MKKIIIFFGIFSLLNLSFIPLMALYGLSICPVLRVPGFFFGCAYSGAFILSVLITNIILILAFINEGPEKLPRFIQERLYLIYIFNYSFATAIGLIFLKWLFNLNHLSGDSRAPEILALTSIVLCITQIYGLSWALGNRYPPKNMTRISFDQSWLQHTLRTMAPIVIALVVLTHFLLIQSLLQESKDAIPATTSEIIKQSNYIILFVVGWLSVTYLFHFMSERENALNINQHLKKLEEGDFNYVSKTQGSWGLWASLVNYMNDFSKAFNERTRLLKSFSRFVTSEVAQHALRDEITSTSGIEEELTVIMSDIRDFTSLTQQLGPTQVVELLNEYFTVMLYEMIKHSITVDKFIGDGILAYVENSTGDKVLENRRAVTASLAMLERLEKHNQLSSLAPIKIGLGVCRGPLIKGYIGSRDKLQHTIIGETVNRAARLESLCKDLGVTLVIADDVYASLDADHKALFRIFENVRVKGYSKEINVYGLSS